MTRRRARYSRKRRTYSRRKYGSVYRRSWKRRAGYRRPRRTAYQMKRTKPVHLVKTIKHTSQTTIGGSSRTIIASSSSAASNFTPTFANLPDSSSLKQVFKYYRFNSIFMKFVLPVQNVTKDTNTNSNILDTVDQGRIYIIPDPKNIIDPLTITEAAILEMGPDVRRIDLAAMKTRCIKYKTRVYNLYPGPVVTGAAVGQNVLTRCKQWHDVTADNTWFTWGHIIHFCEAVTSFYQPMSWELKQYVSLRGNK